MTKLSLFVSISMLMFLSACEGTNSDPVASSTSEDTQSESITFHGLEYNNVKSPYTGRIWLDRNIGASKSCEYKDEEACFGDYFQWGRGIDGHEKIAAETTETPASDVQNVGHSKFITATDIANELDWAYPTDSDGSIRSHLWSKTDGSTVCPVGYRVPTINELSIESDNANVQNIEDAFNSFLKIPSTGTRSRSDGAIYGKTGATFLWSTSVLGAHSSYTLSIADIVYHDNGQRWASGYSVRCIKD
jgi:hypothetical protein